MKVKSIKYITPRTEYDIQTENKNFTIHGKMSEFVIAHNSLILCGIIDGKIVAKSKTSINSDHAKKAQELIDSNEKLQRFIDTSINEGYTSVFELCGPGEFKIVLNYTDTELVFLGYVDKLSAFVLNSDENTDENFKELTGIRRAKIYDFSWEELERIQAESVIRKLHNKTFDTFNEFLEFVKI